MVEHKSFANTALKSAGDPILSERDLMEIEKAHPQGLSSAQVIHIFQARGVRFSEATFRKYVQLGLLPRSRRVGSKGKHRGSHGVYPCATVRRINTIKTLMGKDLTIEEIQRRLGGFRTRIDAVETALEELFEQFDREVTEPLLDLSVRRDLVRDVGTARRTAGDLVRRIMDIEERMTLAQKDQRNTSMRGLAER